MKTKEEYVEWVKEWKITHEALVKLQLYVKKYLIKSVYPQEKYKLTQDEIKKCLKRLEEVYNEESRTYHWAYAPRWAWWTKDSCESWEAAGKRWILREELHKMYDIRSLKKEQFKNSLLESVEV